MFGVSGLGYWIYVAAQSPHAKQGLERTFVLGVEGSPRNDRMDNTEGSMGSMQWLQRD